MPQPEPDPTHHLPAGPIRDLAAAQSALAHRLDALEHAIKRRRAGGDDKARLDKLQEAVTDLAAGHHDVHRQLDALAGAIDLLAAERLEQGDDEASTAAGTTGDRPRPATFVPPVASRFPRLKRWARAILRSTLGKARHLWDTTHPRPPWGDDIRLVMKSQPARLPSLAVVVPAAREEADGGATAVEARLDRQTDRDVRRVRRGDTVDSDYVWDVAPGVDVPPTFIEAARWLLATEQLGFVCFEAPDGAASQWIVLRELCDGDGSLDLRALARRAKRHPGDVLGKIAGGDGDLLPRALCQPRIRRRLRRSGPYVVAVATRPRTISHAITGLKTGTGLKTRTGLKTHTGLKTRATGGKPAEAGSGRDGVLVLVSAELAGGLERVVAAVLEDLGDDVRPVLATTIAQGFWRARWRALERFTPHLYDLGGIFAEDLHAGVLEELIARQDVSRLLHAGDGEAWPSLAAALRRIPDLQIADSALPRVDPESSEVPADARERVRADLGCPPETLLIAMSADLIAGQRPEDFVALAHRFRDDPRFRFLLAGDGPLSAGVRDLERLFGLRNLHIERPRRELGEILAAADVVCTTAESDPYPYAAHAALRYRRPVVAAAADLRELLAAGPCGIVVPHPGDLDGFEAALRSLIAAETRRQLGDRGPAAIRDTLG